MLSDTKTTISVKEKTKKAGGVIYKSLLTFAIVVGIGLLGTVHFQSVKKKNRKPIQETSGGVKEPIYRNSFPSRQKLFANGINFDIMRDYTSEHLYLAKSNTYSRKTSLGWQRISLKDSPIDNITGINTINHDVDFFITNKNEIVAYMFSKLGSGTKVTQVSFNIEDFNQLKEGKTSPRIEFTTPSQYAAIMPKQPNYSISNPDSNEKSIFVCSLDNSAIEDISYQIKKRLDINGWHQELWETVSETQNLIKKGDQKMIAARKNDILCNIIITKDSNKTIASYRFSKLKNSIQKH